MTDPIYRTSGAWGAGKGSDLTPAEVDGNFYGIDQRVAYLEDNPTAAIYPVSASMDGSTYTIGYSNDTEFSVIWEMPRPRYRGPWAPDTSYLAIDYFLSPEGGFGAVLKDHVSAATFDWNATSGGDAVYLKLVGPSGTTDALGDLTNVTISGAANGDFLVYQSGFWVNSTPATATLTLSVFVGDTGSGGVKGLVPAPGTGDAAAGKFLKADGTWAIPPGSGGGSTSLAGLSDIQITSLANGHLLQYDSTLGKWKNIALSSVGGTITGVTAGTGLSGGGSSGSVTVSLASVSTARILANISGASAAPSANSLTAILDAIIGSDRGSIIRRDATGWTVLTPGPAGTYLKSGGTGADVSWDTPVGSGTITEVAAGTGLTGGGTSGSVTVALDSIADDRLLANISGGSAAPSANTLTAILDHILGSGRGQIIYRGASSWAALSPGQSGWYLQTKGSAGDPAWAKVSGGGVSGTSGVSTSIWGLGCDYATAAALAANTYSNGTSGVGATLTGNSNGAISIDGNTPSVADRILVKDEAAPAHNGVYVVTTVGSGGAPYVLTRASDYDQTSEIVQGSAFAISGGDTNINTAWVLITGGAITIGTTSLEFEALTATLPDCAEGEVLGNAQSYDAPAIPTNLARMLRASLGDGIAGQVITSNGPGVDATWETPPGGGGLTTYSKTADYTVLTSDDAARFNNIGASADIVLSLPAAADGLSYAFAVFAAHYIKLLADGSDEISIGTDSSAGGGYVRSNAPYSFISIEAHSTGRWVVSSMTGAWSIDA